MRNADLADFVSGFFNLLEVKRNDPGLFTA